MPNEDLELSCIQCGEKFIFTKGEQQQWAKRGFVHQPKRCRKCREERRARTQKYYHSNDYRSVQNIYRAPAFRNQYRYQSTYRSPMEGSWRPHHKEFEITCSKCGETDTIPFKPSPGRDVYCHKCYEEIKKSGHRKKQEKETEKEQPKQTENKPDKDST